MDDLFRYRVAAETDAATRKIFNEDDEAAELARLRARVAALEAERDALAAQVAEVRMILEKAMDERANASWLYVGHIEAVLRALASAPKVLAVVEGMFDAQMQIDDIRDLSQSFCDLGYNASGFIPVRVIVTERGE